jgi:choline dehydrogenase-like flavoprotein
VIRLSELYQQIKHSATNKQIFSLKAMFPQSNLSSKLHLDYSQTCKLGLPIPVINWQLPVNFNRQISKTSEIIGEYFRKEKIGIFRFDNEALNLSKNVVGGYHHMGTTAFSTSGDALCDKKFRIIGENNIVVLGSSTFQSTSFVNPTASIVLGALYAARAIN